MKRVLLTVILSAAALASAQTSPAAPPTKAATQAPAKSATTGGLEAVLNDMDRAAAGFRSAQADFVWDQFSKVVNDHDLQKGAIYYRLQNKEVQMAADIQQPAKKYVLFSGGKVEVYQPEIDQVTEYNAGKNKAEFESFLVLGFGGRGHDLAKSFEVHYDGAENVDGVQAAKLTLLPKAAKVKGMFSQIILWIDPARGISVQQQFIEPSGDYRLAKYTNIKLNQKLSDAAFKLNTTGKTKWVRPQQAG
ncbi:MAG: LolA family protein [Terriglobales bacterium]